MPVLVHDTSGLEFDYETQRFIIERWETTEGKAAYEKIINGIKNSVDIRSILDDYVVDIDDLYASTYSHPYYPKHLIKKNEFWLLNNDDLRGISIFKEEFESTSSIDRKSLEYSSFFRVIFRDSTFYPLGVSRAKFFNCQFINCGLYSLSGVKMLFKDCSFKNSTLTKCYWHGVQILNTTFRNTKIADFTIKDCEIDHLSFFDDEIKFSEYNGKGKAEYSTDFYRGIRIAYEHAEIFSRQDHFLFKERKSRRKYIVWKNFLNDKKIETFRIWSVDFLWSALTGYGTKPHRLIVVSIFVSLFYAFLYWHFEVPLSEETVSPSFLESLYFSFTAFATLGFGDLAYGSESPFLRLLSTSEAWIGAIILALFVAVVARKLVR